MLDDSDDSASGHAARIGGLCVCTRVHARLADWRTLENAECSQETAAVVGTGTE